jgi:polyhydroxyalkanoate synthase
MTEQEHNSNSFDPFFQPFVEHWAACVQQANDATKKMFGGFEGSPDPRVWRRQWFDTLSGNTDTYLRSPPFLQVMKAHIDALIQAKRRMNELPASGVRAGGATASDLQTFEDRLAELEKALHSRLSQLEQRMDAIENQPLAPIEADGWDRFLKALQIPHVKPELTMGTTPHEVIYQEGTLRLLRYCNDKVTVAEPILICFALVNRPYVLDLQGDRSVVRQLLDRGFDVYLIDWGTPTDADRTLRLEDYVCGLLKNVTDFVCKHTSNTQLNLLGYCMGGTMSTMFTALYQERIRNLILMATPIDFSGDEGMLNLWARQEYFDVDRLIDAYGNCPGEFLQYCFQLMKPVQNIAEKYLTFCERLDDDSFLDNFFAMERWASDSIPVAGETFREYVKKLYQQNLLVKGEMTLGDHAVKLDAITCPLLLLVAEHDHLVPPSSTLVLEEKVSSKNVESMSINAGHIGLAVSTKAHRQLWPNAANWIADHSTAGT